MRQKSIVFHGIPYTNDISEEINCSEFLLLCNGQFDEFSKFQEYDMKTQDINLIIIQWRKIFLTGNYL